MMTGYLQLFFQSLIVASLVFAGFRIRGLASQRNNELKVVEWFEAMDAISNNQRWRGERSRIIEMVFLTKQLTGVDLKLLCVTQSGRWFMLKIQSRWCQITNWQIDPTEVGDIIDRLGVTKEDVVAAWMDIHWVPKDLADQSSAKHRRRVDQSTKAAMDAPKAPMTPPPSPENTQSHAHEV